MNCVTMNSACLGFDSDLSDICDSEFGSYTAHAPLSASSSPMPGGYYTPPESPPTSSMPPVNNLHTAPVYTSRTAVRAHNSNTSVMCGCEGHFFWEIVPAENLNYYRGTAPDCVDSCIFGMYVYKTFNEALWDAYGQCVE